MRSPSEGVELGTGCGVGRSESAPGPRRDAEPRGYTRLLVDKREGVWLTERNPGRQAPAGGRARPGVASHALRRAVSAGDAAAVTRLPPSAFRRRRAHELLLRGEPVALALAMGALSLAFFGGLSYLLFSRFPQHFVYVQIAAFILGGSGLPWLFHGLHGPTGGAVDFWASGLLLLLAGAAAAGCPRLFARALRLRGTASAGEAHQRDAAMLLCGMQAFALGLGLLWEGATLPPPHAPFEPPHFATEPQLARVMLAAGWTVALVVLRFLAARAPLLGIEVRIGTRPIPAHHAALTRLRPAAASAATTPPPRLLVPPAQPPSRPLRPHLCRPRTGPTATRPAQRAMRPASADAPLPARW